MSVAPTASATTSPVAETLAMPGAMDDHVTVRPSSGTPTESSGTAANCAVSSTKIVLTPVSAMLRTGTGATVIATESASLSLYSATSQVVPTPCAVTRPV